MEKDDKRHREEDEGKEFCEMKPRSDGVMKREALMQISFVAMDIAGSEKAEADDRAEHQPVDAGDNQPERSQGLKEECPRCAVVASQENHGKENQRNWKQRESDFDQLTQVVCLLAAHSCIWEEQGGNGEQSLSLVLRR